MENFQYFVVKKIYADHNDARNVRLAIKKLLKICHKILEA